MRARAGWVAIALLMYAAAAVAQDRVSLRPGFKVGDESRYTITASVETTVTPKGSDGIGGTSRGELTATVVVRTLGLSETGEVNQEALVEAINFRSGKGGVVSPPGTNEVAGKRIEFATGPSGYLSRCSIPESRGYLHGKVAPCGRGCRRRIVGGHRARTSVHGQAVRCFDRCQHGLQARIFG